MVALRNGCSVEEQAARLAGKHLDSTQRYMTLHGHYY
jgi:hypothetical protein